MPEVKIRPVEAVSAPCPSCGRPAGLVRGRADRDGDPYAVYLLDWCESEETRRAMLTLSIGDWSLEAPETARTTVAVEMGAEGWRLADAPEREDLDGYGAFAGDAEVRRRGAVDQVRAMARLVMAEDPAAAEVNAWVVGERDSAIPASA